MQNFDNTVGFITGGASGIGLGMARALGERGMALMLADIEAHALQAAAEELRAEGLTVETVVLDVSDHDAFEQAAATTLAHFGKVNFLFNNAGVGSYSPVGSTPIADWRWVVNVNLLGVAYGVECFLPSMLALGEPCYIINTASFAGHVAGPGLGPYNATKFAVVGYSETMRAELADTSVGVAVLCPAWVKTRIGESRRNHPDSDGEAESGMNEIASVITEEGIDVSVVVDRVLAGMADGTFNLFTHSDFWPLLASRLEEIAVDYQKVL